MNLYQVARPNDDYDYGSPAMLDEYDAEELKGYGFSVAWYHYSQGGYEGSGFLLGKLDTGEWGSMDLGHCSCYGPTGGKPTRFATLDEFKARATQEVLQDASTILAAIEAA